MIKINNKLKCPNCKRILDASLFQKSQINKDGHKTYCRECAKFNNDRKLKKLQNLKNKKAYFITKEKFKKLGKWLYQQKRICEYCEILEKDIERNNNGHIIWGRCNHLTIDRKDSNKGYEVENICLACMRCNRIKSDIFSYEEMVIIGKMLNKKNLRPK